MEKALREIEKVLQEVVKVGSLVELCMEKLVEEELTVAELPFTLQEKVSRWPDLSKMETEEKINKMFRLLEALLDFLIYGPPGENIEIFRSRANVFSDRYL